jgi:glycosyltransferase involved in cell wall biosynthesis
MKANSDRRPDVLIIVAAFNEAPVIAGVVEGLRKMFANVLVVDDGSSDDSGDRARDAGAVVVRHPVNLGQGAALQTGFSYGLAREEFAVFVTFDADGQHRPEDAMCALERLEETGADIVFGTRFLGDGVAQIPRLRRLILRLARIHANRASGLLLTDAHNGLRAFRRAVAEAFDLQHTGMAHASEIANIVGSRGFVVAEQPVQVLYTEHSRAKGQSAWNAVNIVFDLYWRR